MVYLPIVVGYIGVSAVLRRIPATSLRLPTGPIPDTWDDVVEHSVPLEKHFEGCGGLTLTEEMKVTIAATWGGVLSEEYERLRGDAEHDRQWALDGYGATNTAEFFAVATESFFEKPVQLEREHPALYGQLREFYRQDPARRTPSIDP